MGVTVLDERIVKIAIAEWWAWGGQYRDGESKSLPIKKLSSGTGTAGDEDRLGFKQRVFTYFKMGVYPHTNDWKNYRKEPWSAAFISYIFRLGGAGNTFPYSVGHHTYVSRAVRNNVNNQTRNTLVAYSSKDEAPEVGDLLWRGRKPETKTKNSLDTSKWGLDDIIKHLKAGKGSFPSHCDLVVQVDYDNGVLYSIGGNVSDRVLRLKSEIEEGGMLQNSQYTVVIKNNISEYTSNAFT